MKKGIYALLMMVALMMCQHTMAQETKVLYSADYKQIAADWTQEGDLVENLWSLQDGQYTAYGFAAEGPATNWLVSPEIKLESQNVVSFNHVVYQSMFGDATQEAQFVIREVGGEWELVEGVHYPTGYSAENSGDLSIPEKFNGKNVQFAFQYKKTADNTGLWGIVDINVTGVEAAEPTPQGGVIYEADYKQIAADWTQEGDLVENLWSLQDGQYTAYGFAAEGPVTNWLVSPVITLKENNVASFNHVVYQSMFGDATQEAQFVIREVGGEWELVEGVHYPTGYSAENSGDLAIPAKFNGKDVQFAFQYKKTADNTGLWGIVDFKVTGAAGAEPTPEGITLPYEVDYTQIATDWIQEGDLVENLWSLQDGQFTAYAYAAEGPVTNWLVSPVIALEENNVASFNHVVYQSMFGDATQEAQFVIREVGSEWEVIEGVNYPTGYSAENSGDLAIPAKFNNKSVQFAFQYKKTAENTGLWGIVDFKVIANGTVTGIESINAKVINDNKIYDLQGRVVTNPNKGIYIVNGKKVIFK